MLSVLVFLPLVCRRLLLLPQIGEPAGACGLRRRDRGRGRPRRDRLWAAYDAPASGELAFEEQARWIPGVGSSYHVGVDGLSLPLVVMTTVVFLACAVFASKESDRPRLQAALFLFLESVSLGLFVSADLILFFVFFDLSIVGDVLLDQRMGAR